MARFTPNNVLLVSLLAASFSLVSLNASAEVGTNPPKPEKPAAEVAEAEKPAEPVEAVEAVEEVDEVDASEDEDVRESEDGSYEWKRSYGFGVEAGLTFNDLSRWNILLSDNDVPSGDQFDIVGLTHIDFAFEASLLEKTRLTIFGGIQTPFSSNPSSMAYYLGIEPAFAFRRDMWELALGFGIGLGAVDMEVDSGESFDAGLIVLRPFFEVRRYLSGWFALYGRVGFNQWLVDDPEFSNLEFQANGELKDDDNLNIGGAYLALGVRFGSYPEHIKHIPDTDGDGLKDDIDDCPEEAEDVDGFEDLDGCPDLDNDNDTIPDAIDRCPLEAEDMDGWMDEDGCPESDDDADGDGFLNTVDKCPMDAEDKDGFEDDDGCPDLDNDNDGILDVDDKCPNKAGVPQKAGCPFEKVEVTMKGIVILDRVFFEYKKSEIKEESFGLLNDVAATILAFPRIKKIEVQGHTDHAGSEKYNVKLSGSRAQSVVDYLVKQGVAAERLTSKGYGFSQPLHPKPATGKETKEHAQENRRVEFVITEQDEVKKTVYENELPTDAKPAPKATPEAAKPAPEAAKPAPEAAKPAPEAAKPE